MTDREKAIIVLEDIIATAEGIKEFSEYGGITISLDDKIDSIKFALESLKADASDKTDRGEVIATLTEHLDHWKRLLSEGVCTKDEGERTINALTFAIESIKALDEIVVRLDLMISKYGRSAINGIEVAKKIVNEYRKEQE